MAIPDGFGTGTLTYKAQGDGVPAGTRLKVLSWRAVNMSAGSNMVLSGADGAVVDKAHADADGYTDMGAPGQWVDGLTLSTWTSATGDVQVHVVYYRPSAYYPPE